MTKFMCKEFLLTLFSLMFGIAGVNAQVTIGADEAPHSGAILDLRSDTTTGKGKGLKLPVVKIEDASKFQLSADASTAEGMMVFNINPSIIGGYGKGLYVWSNSTWNLVSPTVSVSGISLNKDSIKFTTLTPDILLVEVFPTYSVNNGVSWHSSNTAVATVSQDGIVTPKSNGNAKIYVTTTDGSNQSDSCAVSVAFAVTGVALDESTLTFTSAITQKLTATVAPDNALNKAIEWSTKKTNIVTVSSDGKVIPIGAGRDTIIVTTKDGAYKDTCVVTVNVAGIIIPPPVCSQGDVPGVIFTPYNLGADTTKMNSIAAADNISKTKAAIKYSVDNLEAVFGDLYQWGRIADGHEKINAPYQSVCTCNNDRDANGQVAGNLKGTFIGAPSVNYPTLDWYGACTYDGRCAYHKHDLWGNGVEVGTSTSTGVPHADGKYYQSTEWKIPANNPCPSGFRIPTQDEIERIFNYDCNPNEIKVPVDASASAYSYDVNTGLSWVRVNNGKASNSTNKWQKSDKVGWAVYRTADWKAAASAYKNGTAALYESAAPEALLFFPAETVQKNAAYGYLYTAYWTSSVGTYGDYQFNAANSAVFIVNSTMVGPSTCYRKYANPIRCVAE